MSLKVINIQAENFKRIRAIDITPGDENVVLISGKNEQGKSSVIDAIWAAVGGSDMVKSTGTVAPIRNGEKNARVRLDLGELVVTRKWTERGSTLVVENREGDIKKSPQTVFDSFVGKIAFDPMSFVNKSDDEQRKTLINLDPLS